MVIRKVLLYVILGVVIVTLAVITAPMLDHANSWMEDPATQNQIHAAGYSIGQAIGQLLFGR